jgi:hypothetical protein
MKKAQVNQVFTFIIMILLIGLVVFVGFKGISSIFSKNCQNQDIEFEKSFEKYLSSYSDKGLLRKESLTAPCETSHVCVLDFSCTDTELSAAISNSNYDFITSNEKSTVLDEEIVDKANNIFVKKEHLVPTGYSDELRINDPLEQACFACFEVKNTRLEITFEGQGRTTAISQSR